MPRSRSAGPIFIALALYTCASAHAAGRRRRQMKLNFTKELAAMERTTVGEL